MLKKTINELNLAGIRWWLNSGSLLGAIRDGGIPKGDTDIDIAMYWEDAYLIQTLDLPIQVNYKFNGVTSYFTIPNGNTPINVLCYLRIGDYRYYCQADWMQDRLPHNVELEKRTFEGIECNVPVIWEQLLNTWFTDWKTPAGEIGQTEIYKIQFHHHENKWEDQVKR